MVIDTNSACTSFQPVADSMQVTTSGHLGGLLGPVFLLAPLALFSLRRKEGRRLLLAALVFGANYFDNIGTRFLIPSLPSWLWQWRWRW